MKLFIFIFLSFTSVFAQEYVGTYTKNITTNAGTVLNYKLDLAANGTYEIAVFRNIGQSTSTDENFYGKGNWKVVNTLIVFSSVEIAEDTLYINMNGTTARFATKKKKELRFFNCPSLWFKNATLEKN